MIANTAQKLRENVQKVIVGKHDAINLALVAILCEGHILLEDVPGIGKTTLARAGFFTGLYIPPHSIYSGFAAFRCNRTELV